jgi:transketolase
MALHGGIVPYGGTFLTFSDYAPQRAAHGCLMKAGSILVFTHDSVGLGEDGPTHQAIEHAATLRYIPNMEVWRPCDTTETAIAWIAAIERRDGPELTAVVAAEPGVSSSARLNKLRASVAADTWCGGRGRIARKRC